MESVKELVDNFCDTHNLERSIECENGVVDNGAKSITSIMSKIKRAYDSGEKNYSLSDITDLTRCAIIVDDYSKMAPLLIELSKKLNGLTGYVSRQKSGYMGLHLMALTENIPSEIQLSTKDVWLAKQASEYIYARHREFDKSRLKELEKIKKLPAGAERKQESLLFKQKEKEYVDDYEQTCELFREVHKQTDFYDNMNILEGILISFSLFNPNYKNRNFEYDELLKQHIIQNGLLMDINALKLVTEIKPALNNAQNKLIDALKSILLMQNFDKGTIPEREKNIIDLRNSIELIYQNYFPIGAITKYSEPYSNFIKTNINSATSSIGNELYQNGILNKVNSIDLNQYLIKYDKDPEIVKDKIDRKMYMINKYEEVIQSL